MVSIEYSKNVQHWDFQHTHVSNGKSLYRLVLWGASRAVAASDGLDVAAAVLVTSTVNQLLVLDHCFRMNIRDRESSTIFEKLNGGLS